MLLLSTKIDELVNIAGDYQNCKFDKEHVEKWLGQFPEDSQETIIEALNYTLEKSYVSKGTIKNYIQELIEFDGIFNEPISNFNFLNIQIKGSSQIDLLQIFEENSGVAELKYVTDGKFSGERFIYIDDVFYTGNRLRRDIENWVNNVEDKTRIKRLDIVYYFIYDANFEFVKDKLKELLPNTEIKIWRKSQLNNNIKKLDTYDAYLPCENPNYSTTTNDFISKLDNSRSDAQKQYINLLRPAHVNNKSEYFTNEVDRRKLESALFEAGVSIYNAEVTNESFKPMGYDYNKTLGFGNIIITFRNAPNNSPLALWWGTENLNSWYPLFPRKVY
ncbi:hypothetical protein C3943_08485 [Lysinibacillus sp. B2A1]|nr:hypothetical protein C3943_08485 [Lysinibacillus sp. B2A1]